MTAQLPISSASRAAMRHRPTPRAHGDTCIVAFCWLSAGAGLAGSYVLEALALQAAACLLGLTAVAAALLLMVAARSR
jgi:hypothetical protein